MFCTRVAWVCLVCLLLCKEEGSSPVSAITERRDMGLHEVPLSVSLLGFGIGTMLAQLPCVRYYVFVKSSFKHTRDECVVMSGDDVCCSVVFGTLVGVFVFSVMWSELLMTSAINCPLWSTVYECQRVECAFTSPVRTECGMFVMYCMQCCMSVSAVLWCVDVVSRGGI